MSDDPRELIDLNQRVSDDRSESIHLNQHDTDGLRELITLNQHNNDDPRESITLNQHENDDPRESITLNQHDNDDPRESITLNQQDNDDPCELITLNQHDNDDSSEWITLNQHDNDDPGESITSNQHNDDLHESIRLNQYYSDLGYSRKTQVCDDITFTTSAVGLIELSNVVYNTLCKISPRFEQCVSSSMFTYYVSQLHYMRLCILEWEVSKPDADDLRIMYNEILRNRWTVPQLLADYFNCIGPFKDSAGIPAQHREIVFPCADNIQGINGFFGRVDSNTHAHYENRISPGVTAMRIIVDLMYTDRPRDTRFWNLPRILVPEEKNAGLPTGNLLGWSLATSLTAEQVNALKDCGIFLKQVDFVFSHSTQFCHNSQLMSYISSHLNELRGKVKCVDRLSTIPRGSIAQHDFQLVDRHRGSSRAYVYGNFSVNNCGFAPLHAHQELFATVFRLRILRNVNRTQQGGTANPWCCYDFHSFKNVPDSWTETRNSYFLFGKFRVWDVVRFKSPPAELKGLLDGLMAKTLIP